MLTVKVARQIRVPEKPVRTEKTLHTFFCMNRYFFCAQKFSIATLYAEIFEFFYRILFNGAYFVCIL